MSWHRVIIKHSEEAHLFAQGLMIPFVQQYKEAGTPEGVSVYISRDDGGDRTYYFSSNASSMAKDLLHTFKATRCFAEPNLDTLEKFVSKFSTMDSLPRTFIMESRVNT